MFYFRNDILDGHWLYQISTGYWISINDAPGKIKKVRLITFWQRCDHASVDESQFNIKVIIARDLSLFWPFTCCVYIYYTWNKIKCNEVFNFLFPALNFWFTIFNWNKNIASMTITMDEVFIKYHSIKDVHSYFSNIWIHDMPVIHIIRNRLGINKWFN